MAKAKLPRWELPPSTEVQNRTPTEQIDREVAAMRRNPGQWMKVRENASSGAYTVYKRRGCLVKVKTVAEQRYDVWACWPEDGKPAQ